MSIGTSILLIAAGAIIRYALTFQVSGVSRPVIGLILMIVGIVLPGPLKLIMIPLNCGFPILWLVVDIMAMVKAYGGQRMRVPVVTDMAEKMFGA